MQKYVVKNLIVIVLMNGLIRFVLILVQEMGTNVYAHILV